MKSMRILAAAFALSFFTAIPASAHTELVSSNPAEGTVLAVVPAEIVLTFNEPPMLAGSAISVRGDSATSAPAGPNTVIGSELHAPWPTEIESGNITIDWRAVADDGHVVTGAINFVIGTDAVPMPFDVSTAVEKTATDSSSKTPWIGLGIVLFAGILLAGILARRNK